VSRIGAATKRHPWRAAALAAACAGAVSFILIYFAPQDLFIDTSLDERLPSATATNAEFSTDLATGPATRSLSTSRPSVLARGRFRSGEHHTSGVVLLLALTDNRVFVRLEGLDTSNGPDVRIWLSSADYRASDDVVHSAAHLDLGGLKANHGNQNYLVPPRTELSRYHSVVVWCRRFDVAFGAAPLSA
jgi:hypothetical protein